MPRRVSKPRREAPDPAKPHAGATRTVERDIRLSRSRIWDLQRAFFVGQDPRAWGRGRVPSYITSNACIARSAARVLTAFLDDVADGRLGAFDPSAPVHVLELGAGSGRFSFNVLRALSAHEGARVRYVVTDFDAAPVEALRESAPLRPFVAQGLLDFAVLDVEAPGHVVLLESGEVLRADPHGAPVAAVANYVFDGVRTDAFAMRDGLLHEALLRLECPEDVDADSPEALGHFALHFDARPADASPYGDAELDARLHELAAGLPEDGFFLFPHETIRFLRHLRGLGGGRALLLAADRGHVHADSLRALDAPHLARHGSVSLDVNFHALALHARATGGDALLPAHHPTHLATVGLLWGAADARTTRTHRAYREHYASGPEDFYVLKETLDKLGRRLTVERALTWLRTSAWDAHVFLACAALLIDRAPTSPPTVCADMRDAARRVHAAYYPVGGDPDVAMALGELMQELDSWSDAAALFDESLARHGRAPDTLHRRALCASVLERAEEARALVEEALRLDPRHEDARALRDALDES